MQKLQTSENQVNSDHRPPEWHEERRTYVGASEAPIVAGLTPWMQPAKLWAIKKGLIPPDDLSDRDHIHFGNVLEDVVAREFMRRTGKKVRRVNRVLRHPEHPWMGTNLDRDVVGEDAVLQCKIANSFKFAKEWGTPGTDEVPEPYFIQEQHEMAVAGRSLAYVAVLTGNWQFAWYQVPRNDQVIEDLITIERDFIDSLDSDTPPPIDYEHPSTLDLMKRLYPGTDGRIIRLPDESAALAEEYAILGQTVRDAEKRREAVKARLLEMCGSASVGLLPDGTGFRRKLIAAKDISYTRAEYIDFRFSKNPTPD